MIFNPNLSKNRKYVGGWRFIQQSCWYLWLQSLAFQWHSPEVRYKLIYHQYIYRVHLKLSPRYFSNGQTMINNLVLCKKQNDCVNPTPYCDEQEGVCKEGGKHIIRSLLYIDYNFWTIYKMRLRNYTVTSLLNRMCRYSSKISLSENERSRSMQILF